MLARTWRARTALVPVALLVACLKSNAPTGLGPNDVRFALSTQVSGGSSLHITVDYLVQPSVLVTLVDRTINVAAGTANVPLTVDLTRCLADPQHVATAASTCELEANVVLMQGGTTVDSVTVGPVTVTPGQTVQATASVTAIGRVVVFPDTVTLTVGAITILRDSVFAASGAYLANSPVTWSTADTTIATVNDSGAVTGRGVGSTQVTAKAGSVRASATVNVLSSGSGGLQASIGAVEFSAPAGGTIPGHAVMSITSTDSTVVGGLTATITYGSGTTGWLLANVSDSEAPARVAPRGASDSSASARVAPRGASDSSASARVAPRTTARRVYAAQTHNATVYAAQTQNVTTPALLDIVPSTTSLPVGQYTATITVTGNGARSVNVSVTYTISSGALLTLPVDTATFLEYAYGTTLAASRQFNVVNGGTGSLGTVTWDSTQWNADTGYLSVGITSSTITIQPNTTALPHIGNQYAILWFSAAGASNNPQSITVYMQTALTYAKVVAGAAFACGLTTEGAVYCWGDNTYGEFGDNSTTSPAGPYGPARVLLPITTTDTVVDVAAGARHACALMSNNQVYCWGDNTQGQLGQGSVSSTPVRTPVLVTGGRSYSAIATGAYHTCAIEGTGGANILDCWGSNSNGQLGTNNVSPVSTPTALNRTFATVSAGVNNTCGLTALSAGAIYCWGDNTDGQLGVGTTGGNDTLPQLVTLTGGAVPAMVSAGSNVACAIDVNANAYCWGDNTYGELGTNGGPASSIPIQVSSGQYATISAGNEFACGIATTGIVAYCWGLNGNGQLGVGSTASYATAPTAVALPFSGAVTSLVASPQGPELCVVGAEAACAGNNAGGQLGYFLSFLSINTSPLGIIDQPAFAGTASRVVPRPRVTRRTH